MPFRLERFVNRLQTTLSVDMMTDSDTSMTLTSVVGLPSSGQIRALLTEGSNQEIVLAILPPDASNQLSITRRIEAVGGVQNKYQFHAGATVEFLFTAESLTNDPRNMSAPGDLETLNTDGKVTRIPAGPEGSSYFIVNGMPTSAPGVTASFTNPTTSSQVLEQYLNQTTVTTDSTLQNPTFSNFEIHNDILNVAHGQNDPDQVSKKTFLVTKETMFSRGCGQRLVSSMGLYAWGCGDAFATDQTVYYAGGVTASGDEGQFVLRGFLQEIEDVFTDTIASVAAKPTINTTTRDALSRNGTATQTIHLNGSVGNLMNGQWVVLDAGLIGSAAFNRMEAVKASNVNSANNTFDCVLTHDHPAGAAVVPAVVITLNGSASQWGEQRDVVNLTQPPYTAGTAYCQVQTMYGLSTNWTQNMVGGNSASYSIGYIALGGDDNTTWQPYHDRGIILRAWYPLTGVSDATHLTIYKLSQSGSTEYAGNIT